MGLVDVAFFVTLAVVTQRGEKRPDTVDLWGVPLHVVKGPP